MLALTASGSLASAVTSSGAQPPRAPAPVFEHQGETDALEGHPSGGEQSSSGSGQAAGQLAGPPDRLSRTSTPEPGAVRTVAFAARQTRRVAADWTPPPGAMRRNVRVRQHEYRVTYWLFAMLARSAPAAREVICSMAQAKRLLVGSARRMLGRWQAEAASMPSGGRARLTPAMLAPSREVNFVQPWPSRPRPPAGLICPPLLDLEAAHSDAELVTNWWQITEAITTLGLCIRQAHIEALPEHSAQMDAGQVARRLAAAVVRLHDDPDAGCVDPTCERRGRA